MGAGVDFDLGMIWDIPSPPIGASSGLSLSVNNVLASQFPVRLVGGAPPELSRTFSLGTYAIFRGGKFLRNVIARVEAAEIGLGGQSDPDLGARSGSFWKHFNWGIEMPIWDWLFFEPVFIKAT